VRLFNGSLALACSTGGAPAAAAGSTKRSLAIVPEVPTAVVSVLVSRRGNLLRRILVRSLLDIRTPISDLNYKYK
jgi:hypothetical protein